MTRQTPRSTLFPYTTLFRSKDIAQFMTETGVTFLNTTIATMAAMLAWLVVERLLHGTATSLGAASGIVAGLVAITDRKSTRLNSSHMSISYAVFCLKKKTQN